jgi:hypothetical protein
LAIVRDSYWNDLQHNCCDVLPSDVVQANRATKMREIDAKLCGLFVTRAAISGVPDDASEEFMENHVTALMRICDKHSASMEERLAKVRGRYCLID